ncbi:hypothetical protein DEO72_LG7g1722 [Vigna unguiculata]|uniref:Uncharacterized protein n=1 Tax=Vigna unguiculata TaxID=3917 RepID=A0A4D6MIM6_VIGUN|nr:hypothetical protein DEO72_LG7g1722 [Vigna unguiculata]
MNLPSHGTASPDPSVASLLKTTHKQIKDINLFAWLSLHAARRKQSRSPGGTYPSPGAIALLVPLFFGHRPAEHTRVARRYTSGTHTVRFSHTSLSAWAYTTKQHQDTHVLLFFNLKLVEYGHTTHGPLPMIHFLSYSSHSLALSKHSIPLSKDLL